MQALLRSSAGDPAAIAFALALAFGLGSAHALTPGHGKAIVAAYLSGSRGRISDALYLGCVVTATHTFSVFALGLLALYASRGAALDRIYPWLKLASAILIVGAGAWLLYVRFREIRASGQPEHTHLHPHSGVHSHSHHGHSHARRERCSILSLGISGGLVPCPEALVVLLVAVSTKQVGFGLAVLLSFSAGLAATLMAVGIVVVKAGPLLERFAGESRAIRYVPVASAACIVAIGFAMLATELFSYA